MGLIKELKNIDLTIQSSPWTKEEMDQLSVIIKKAKQAKTRRTKSRIKDAASKRHRA